MDPMIEAYEQWRDWMAFGTARVVSGMSSMVIETLIRRVQETFCHGNTQLPLPKRVG